MKKLLGFLTAVILLTGCGTDENTKNDILMTLETNSAKNADFSEFLKEKGDELKNVDFSPEEMGIPMPTDEELDSSFYDEIISGISKIARETKDTAELEYLAKHSNAGVRSDVAKNPEISTKLQEQLASDEEALVRAYLAANKKLDTAVAEKLSTDEIEMVRRPLAQNPTLPDSILEKFVNDESINVQISLARNKNLSLDLMKKMVESSHDAALMTLIKREDFPAELLEQVKEQRPQLFEESSVETKISEEQ